VKTFIQSRISVLLVFLLCFWIASVAVAADSSKLERNKQVITDFYEAVQSGQISELPAFFTKNYTILDVGALTDKKKSRISETSADITERIKYLREALPGFTIKVNKLVAEGDTVFAYVTMTGVQKGSFLGVEPTGREINMRAFVIYELDDYKIKSAFEMWDQLEVMKQMGYIKID
jgi:steroid delta-isomerase-like uncharacterized protein